MKSTRTRIPLLSSLLAVALAVAGIAITHAEPAPEAFTGHYDWSNGGRGDLIIEFEPDGDDRWQVEFLFRFDGEDNTWDGTAVGNLEDGSELTGTATYGSRKWKWSATVEDGVMRGTHTELKSRNKAYDTGTFEVSR